MVDIELKRDRVTIRLKDKKWEWIIEPRYWRNSILWVALLLVFPAVAYFISPGLDQCHDLGQSFSCYRYSDVADDLRHRPR